MRYNTIVEKDENNLQEIIAAAEQFSEERFLEGIKMKRYNQYEIEKMIVVIREYQQKMNKECLALAKFSETFIQTYATDNNECFTTAYRLFNRIRSTIGATKKVYKKTCPRVVKKLPIGVENPSVYNRSIFSYATYSPDLFGVKSFDENVTVLYEDMKTFFTTVISTLLLCRNIINKERMVKADPDMCISIYNDCVKKVKGGITDFVRMFQQVNTIPASELYERKKKARKKEEFVCQNYHQYNTEDLKISVIAETLANGQKDGLTDLESVLWENNHAKALEVRKIVKNFDLYAYKMSKKNMISSGVIVEFIKWCQIEEANEKRLYSEYFKNNYKGKFELPGWTAISQERKNRHDMGCSNKDLSDSFERQIRITNSMNEKTTSIQSYIS